MTLEKLWLWCVLYSLTLFFGALILSAVAIILVIFNTIGIWGIFLFPVFVGAEIMLIGSAFEVIKEVKEEITK